MRTPVQAALVRVRQLQQVSWSVGVTSPVFVEEAMHRACKHDGGLGGGGGSREYIRRQRQWLEVCVPALWLHSMKLSLTRGQVCRTMKMGIAVL